MNVPLRIGNYALEQPIGRSASGEVWRARHTQLRDQVAAIKLCADADAEAVQRFRREAAIAARLHHPNIVRLYDYGALPPFHYAIFEYVEGGSLRERLERHGRLPLSEALAIFRQIAQALDYAHSLDIIHRDLSPDNILFAPGSGRALLANFGAAPTEDASKTATHVPKGAPSYLSPEHVRFTASVTHLSDIYSLGAVLYHMLAGAPPRVTTPDSSDSLPPLCEQGVAGIPPEVDRVLARLLAPDPAQRFPSAGSAVEALELILARHHRPTQILSGAPAKAGLAEVETEESAPSPVEVVLGPDLAPEPMRRARQRADQLRDPEVLTAILDAYAAEDGLHLRRRQLGRLARFRKVSSRNLFLYQLRVLYEHRSLPKCEEEPDRAAETELRPAMDRWDVPLPPAHAFADQPGGRMCIPGSERIVTCETCEGRGVIVCAECRGKRRVYITRSAAMPAGVASAEASTPAATAAQILAPCPACDGRGGTTCERCAGSGRLIQRQVFDWRRRTQTFAGQDDHPALDIAWLRRSCTPEEIYTRRQANGVRPEWSLVPPLADLVAQAQAALDDHTRIIFAEVVIHMIPVTDVVFDLGQPNKAGLYRLTIYGFENRIPPDWRFLDWERVISVSVLVLVSLIAVIFAVFI